MSDFEATKEEPRKKMLILIEPSMDQKVKDIKTVERHLSNQHIMVYRESCQKSVKYGNSIELRLSNFLPVKEFY